LYVIGPATTSIPGAVIGLTGQILVVEPTATTVMVHFVNVQKASEESAEPCMYLHDFESSTIINKPGPSPYDLVAVI
jgi:hypothetical protein